ncbi:MAG: LLM class flavin-dependent oxidoreductase [Acidimicrobiales bacterium]
MKVRIGVAAGPGVVDDAKAFFRLVDALDDLGYDSIWVPDVITTPTLDPIAALSAAAGRRERLKVGTHLVLPGRNPVLLAKQLATLDRLSSGRLLLLAVLGLRQPAELAAQGVEAADRTAILEEMLHIMRALWRGERVDYEGTHHRCDGVQLAVVPQQDPLEVWLGGQVPAALRRCGRLGEGWMPGLCTPAEAAEAKASIDQAAADAGRFIDGEHFGVNISWVDGPIDDQVAASIKARRPDVAPEDLLAQGAEGLRDRMDHFLAVGFSKFVIRPAVPPDDWSAAVAKVADVLEMQS